MVGRNEEATGATLSPGTCGSNPSSLPSSLFRTSKGNCPPLLTMTVPLAGGTQLPCNHCFLHHMEADTPGPLPGVVGMGGLSHPHSPPGPCCDQEPEEDAFVCKISYQVCVGWTLFSPGVPI